MTFPAFPPQTPFLESQRDTIGGGSPDFPQSSGGREQGKFRPVPRPRLTAVAVVNDDGTAIGYAPSTEDLLGALLTEMRAIRIGMERLLALNEDDVDLLDLSLSENEDDS